jgi:hypothetical protein
VYGDTRNSREASRRSASPSTFIVGRGWVGCRVRGLVMLWVGGLWVDGLGWRLGGTGERVPRCGHAELAGREQAERVNEHLLCVCVRERER